MSFSLPPIVFVGGGNMASAIAGGLLRQGAPAADITVIEPQAAQAQALRERLGVAALPDAEAARAALAQAALVVWAVKPQVLAQAAAPVAPHARQALHLSVAAGIGTDSLARWLGTPRVIRAMPNTPALAGRGMTGLYARPETSEADRALACRVIDATGEHLWVSEEPLLDAVTALSGSGPAYVFYFLEAMQQAGGQMGLPAADALSMLAAGAPGPILVGAGVTGNEIAGRLAARLASGVLCDVVQVNSDLTALMSIFGDAIEVSTAVGGSSPIYTMRHGATEVPAKPTPGAGVVSTFELPAASEKDATVTKFVPAVKGDRPDLTNAKVVVAGGRGVDSEENFHTEVEALADALGGAVGATRDVVDLGWYDPIYQIGQTGVTVSPDVYIGLGVSGAIQHTSGMQTAKKIIVINNDEDAPFFHIADLGVVGDLHEIVPLIVEELAKRK